MSGISLRKIKKAIDILDFRSLRFKLSRCPLHGKSLFVRLNDSMLGVRCVFCGASPIATAIVNVLARYEPDFRSKAIYEMSARGPFYKYLNRIADNLACSEYYDNVNPGDFSNGVMCQDVQRLTFSDGVFDICTSTEVFEHVPNDIKGFREIYRVLKPEGMFVFTVPLHDGKKTVTRAFERDEKVIHILNPEYHDDSIRGAGKVLVFRDYGRDITDKLLNAGFPSVEIVEESDCAGFGYKKEVIVAKKLKQATHD
jgi:SAM-dependent methyltransferase